ncbi:MAG TPA: hypothetical protein VJ761_21385 [Ktedonobacteraceae bacterium]|nr:hypothetical protein [Ktedonobacteraceae bacterium]
MAHDENRGEYTFMPDAMSSSSEPQAKQDQYANLGAQGNDQPIPQYGSRDNKGKFGDQGSEPGYSHWGPHGPDTGEGEEEEENTDPDGYGPQDQFGDLDDQDPYSNLEDTDPGESAGGEGLYDVEDTLYGLAEPLAKPGDESRKARDKDLYGTRGSQDQYGYQK